MSNPEYYRFALFILVGVVCGIVLAYKTDTRDKVDYLSPSFIGALLSIAVLMIFSFVAGLFLPQHYEEEARIKIYSLRDSSSVEGKFLLGSGWIGTEEYYTYYQEAGRGVRKDKVPVDRSVIIEGATTPELVVLRNEYDKEWYWYLGGNLGKSRINHYEFYVPKGTIIQKFTLE